MTKIKLQVLPLEASDYKIDFQVKRIFNAAFAGRDPSDVQHHIEEMAELGVPPPSEFPLTTSVSNHLLSTTKSLQLYAETTSGEVEYVLLWHQGEILLGVGSDHCDLWLERHCLLRSKNVAPNIIASQVWRLSDLARRFDRLVLICNIEIDGHWQTVQRAPCGSLLPPELWIRSVQKNFTETDGTVLFSGTIASLDGVQQGDAYRIELYDPDTRRSLTHSYRCTLASPLEIDA